MTDDKAFYEALGRRIAHCRAEKGMTQATLGLHLTPPVTRAAISNVEKGRQRVLAHTLCAMSEALDVDLLALVPPIKVEPRSTDEVKKSLERKLPREAAAEIAKAIAKSDRLRAE